MALSSATLMIGGFVQRRIFMYGIIAAVFLAGIAGGVVSALSLSSDVESELTLFLMESVQGIADLTGTARPGSVIPVSFVDHLLDALTKYVGLPWLFAFTVIGVPFALGLQFVHGYALGFTAYVFAKQWSLSGLLYAFGGMLPHQLFIVSGQWVVAGAAISFAWMTVKTVRRETGLGYLLTSFLKCQLLTLVGALFISAGVWVEMTITPELIRLVTLITNG